MIFPILTSRTPAWKPLALASAVTLCTLNPVHAQTNNDKTLAPVMVTASRFASDPALLPIGATVITAEEIRSSGVNNVNQAIRKIGGVYGRQSSYGTQDFDLDLGGFGTNSSQNMVVLVDGVRLSENELSVAQMSSIPIDTVERIEIMRGGSSVLYGDGATGGVIQIITKRPQLNATHGSVTTEIGQFNHREVRASVAKGWEGFSLDANVSKLKSDNYRDNNAVNQENFSGGAQWASKEGRVGLRVDIARQDAGFAGALSLAQFESNPHQTTTPNDYASINTDRYTAFIERNLGAWELAAELSHKERTAKAFYDFGRFGTSASAYSGKQTQFSPRVRHLSTVGSMTNELVTGLDFIRWNRVTDSTFSQADTSQKSKAVYVRDEIKVGNARIALGGRHEIFDKDSVDPAPFSTATYSKSQSLNAWELQGSYAVTPLLNLFAKSGQSYRVANADENGYTPIANSPLKGQTSHDLELGGSFGNAAQKISARLFQHRLNNEIFFDKTANFGFGANVNLDPTKRQGIEIEASTRLATAFSLSTNLQHISAKFTEGPNAGNEMVMVPKNIISVRLNWLPADGQSADIGAQWVDSQRYGGDFDNNCSAHMPSFVTLDGRYAKRFGAWELAVAGTNLTDKNYFSNAYGCKSGIYPNAGRQLKVSARYDF
ncbi:MAG: TonB-dependent receptor [bacterium]